MAVSLASILTNLMVISAIRDTEAAASPTFNLVLANLCCANLARAVLVKVAASSGPFLMKMSIMFLGAQCLERTHIKNTLSPPEIEVGA